VKNGGKKIATGVDSSYPCILPMIQNVGKVSGTGMCHEWRVRHLEPSLMVTTLNVAVLCQLFSEHLVRPSPGRVIKHGDGARESRHLISREGMRS